jgi:hypothetical protein
VNEIAPKLATDGAGNWLAVWWGAGNNEYDIFVSRSSDYGETWSETAFIYDAGLNLQFTDSDPYIATDGRGTWLVGWWSGAGISPFEQGEILLARSTDNGFSWTEPITLTPDSTSIQASSSGPHLASDGQDNWIAVWTSMENILGAGDDNDIFVSHSVDNGDSWPEPSLLNTFGTIDPSGQFQHSNDHSPHVTTDRSGNWITVWESNTDTFNIDGQLYIYGSHSQDAGTTWTDPVLISVNPLPDRSLNSRPKITTDGSGNWVIVWESSNNSGDGVNVDQDIRISTINSEDIPTAVISITSLPMGQTNPTSVDFTVTFNRDVLNFNAESDLIITHFGTSHTGTLITGGPQSFTVSVIGIAGEGSFSLAIDTNSDVQSIAGNPS